MSLDACKWCCLLPLKMFVVRPSSINMLCDCTDTVHFRIQIMFLEGWSLKVSSWSIGAESWSLNVWSRKRKSNALAVKKLSSGRISQGVFKAYSSTPDSSMQDSSMPDSFKTGGILGISSKQARTSR